MIQYYIVWIEGLTSKTGGKVKSLTNTGVYCTNHMTKAMRIKQDDIRYMKHYLTRHGISHNDTTFVKTSYAPKSTVYNFPQI